jgi:hypothetical protein
LLKGASFGLIEEKKQENHEVLSQQMSQGKPMGFGVLRFKIKTHR